MVIFTDWLKRNLQVIIVFGSVIIILLVAFTLAVYKFGWDWTGFSEHIGPQLHANQQYQPGKTLWDVLQLFIIPAVLAIIAFLFNRATSRKEQEAEKKRAENEQEIAADNQREAALQSYFDKMAELLLKEDLRKPDTHEEVRNIARARTLAVLRSLDPVRKGSLLRFLYETGLIHKDVGDGIIDLKEADLSGAVVSIINLISLSQPNAPRLSKTWISRDDLRVDLEKANLSTTNLKGAKMYGVKLQEADLCGAYLSKADLSEANLHRAKLHETRLRKTLLLKADLSESDLRKAYLRLADLSEANLRGADLRGANLSEAILREAILDKADLSEAILDKADLRGATYTPEQLDTAKSRIDVIL